MRTLQAVVLIAILPGAGQLGCGGGSPPAVTPSPWVERLQVVAGAGQQGTVGQALGQQVVVKVLDNSGAAMKDKTIRFVVDSGGGGVTPSTTTTDPQGQARATWVLGNLAAAQQVEAQVVAEGGSVLTFARVAATALPDTPSSLLSVSGGSQSAVVGQKLPAQVVVRVVDRFGNPIEGRTVTFSPATQASPGSALTNVDGQAITEWTLGPTAGWQELEAALVGLIPIRVRAYAVLPAQAVEVPTGDPADPTAILTLSTCWGCHGAPGLQLPNADPLVSVAPPGDLVGSATGPSVGSHLKHLTQGPYSKAMPCASCHIVPKGPSSHRMQEQGMVTFSGLSKKTWSPPLEVQPSFDRLAVPPHKPEPMSCNGVYCHGNYRGGNNAVVMWGKQNLVGCGFCHDLPPAAPTHPNLSAGTACDKCHPGYGGAQGDSPSGPTFSVNLETHIDGRLDPSVPAAVVVSVPLGDPAGGQGGRVASIDLGQCWTCHGTAFAAQANADPLASSAPPTDLLGRMTGPAVGAHQRHLVGGAIAGPMECAACHLVSESPLASQHPRQASGKVTFSRMATKAFPGQPAATPSYTQPSCSATYCHGNFANGAHLVMDWTSTGTAACGSCHGLPPAGTHPATARGTACSECHPGYGGATGDPPSAMSVINKAIHLNGLVDVTGPHPANWKDPSLHGLGALDLAQGGPGMSLCTTCHVGFGPVGLVAFGDCNGCHARPGDFAPYTSGTYPNHQDWQTECTFCHGKADNSTGAPPRNTHAISTAAPAQPTTYATVGAHTSHVGVNGTTSLHGTSASMACVACHVTGTGLLDPDHINGRIATVSFGAVGATANAGTYNPGGTQGDARSPSCSANYCHGNFTGGRSATAPWTGTFTLAANTLTCNSCHGQGTGVAAQPPPFTASTPHPLNAACGDCHAGYSGTMVNLARHVDGSIQRPTGCTACHGELNPLVAAQPVSSTSIASAPGVGATATSKDVRGSSLTTSRGVGTHDVHLNGTRSARVACSACHPVPGTNDVSHANGVTAVAFTGLAVLGGIVNATWNGAAGGNTLTCSNTYCHGNFFGGTSTTPTWNLKGTLGCTTCHGAPPAISTGHPQNFDCASCHGSGYSSTGVTGAAVATHLDGIVTLIGGPTVGCTSCHGTAGRAAVSGADAKVAAAPPIDSRGNTLATSVGVGVHQAHVNQGATGAPIAGPISCGTCHPAVGLNRHANGAANVTFTGLAIAGGASSAAYTGGTCSNTYCHGNFGLGLNVARSWTTAGKLACTGCHGSPPAAAKGHPQNADCAGCHGAGYTSTSVSGAALATHLDGTLTLAGGASVTCKSCHGTTGRVGVAGADVDVAVAPPRDTLGNTSATSPRVGAHLAHVNTSWAAGAVSNPSACVVCHPPVVTFIHANGLPDVVFTGLATGNGLVAPGYTGGSCSATYCHGNFPGGNNVTLAWTDVGTVTCGSCHGIPPLVETDGVTPHSASPKCWNCHAGFSSSVVNPAVHLNGVVDTTSDADPALCTSCHGTPGYLSTAWGSDNQVAAAPPRDLAGNTTGPAVGAHRAHLEYQATTRFNYKNFLCINCHVPPTSPTPGLHPAQQQGQLTFSALAARNLAGGWVAPAWTEATGSCSATYCHGGFPGGKQATVTWSSPGPLACNACHGLPPTLQTDGVTPHPASTDCAACHPGYSLTTVNLDTHGDGMVDVIIRRTLRYGIDLPLVQARTNKSPYYDVTGLTPGRTYTVTLSGMTADADLYLFTDSTYLTMSCSPGLSGTLPESCSAVATAGGTVHLQVYQYDYSLWRGSGTGFTLSIQ